MRIFYQSLLTFTLLFFSFSYTQAQTIVYDYLVIDIDIYDSKLQITENGKDYIARKLTKEERNKGVLPVLTMIKEKNKEGWELFNTDARGSFGSIFYLRRIDKEATEAANK